VNGAKSMATIPEKVVAELPTIQPRSWKNRFMRKGSGKEPLRVSGGVDTNNISPHWSVGQRTENGLGIGLKSPNANAVSDDLPRNGGTTMPSLSEARSQRTKKGASGFIRKLKTLNGSFRKDSDDYARQGIYPSVLQESESSPSNPQSPYSTESFVSVEVRILWVNRQ
jgi:hypothetical protein